MAWVIVQFILLGALGASVKWPSGPVLFEGAGAFVMAGQLLIGAGMIIVMAAFASLGRALQVSPHPRDGARLVDRGIYRFLRHPMYTTAVICSVGLVLVQPRAMVAAAAVAVIAFYIAKARFEESLLLERYPEYAAYRSRTLGVFFIKGRQERR
jgi:protein-S-isoprenylcysteine O-methyltransferase Ste14